MYMQNTNRFDYHGVETPHSVYQIRRISRQKSKFVKMDATLSGRTTAVKVIVYKYFIT